MNSFPMLPREAEAEKLRANIAKGQPTLLLGDVGIGKTVLLKQVVERVDRAIYIDTISPFKSAVLELSFALHQRGDFQIEGIRAEYLPWEDIEKKLARQTIRTLLALITQNLAGKGYVLCLDALENATPTMVKHITALMSPSSRLSDRSAISPLVEFKAKLACPKFIRIL